jgi:hypothetical protein
MSEIYLILCTCLIYTLCILLILSILGQLKLNRTKREVLLKNESNRIKCEKGAKIINSLLKEYNKVDKGNVVGLCIDLFGLLI